MEKKVAEGRGRLLGCSVQNLISGFFMDKMFPYKKALLMTNHQVNKHNIQGSKCLGRNLKMDVRGIRQE